MDRLYYDFVRDKPKPGATSRRVPGNLRRLIDVINQFDVTYDVYSMDAAELAALLPSEFRRWTG